jgi:hypothetical protein
MVIEIEANAPYLLRLQGALRPDLSSCIPSLPLIGAWVVF